MINFIKVLLFYISHFDIKQKTVCGEAGHLLAVVQHHVALELKSTYARNRFSRLTEGLALEILLNIDLARKEIVQVFL